MLNLETDKQDFNIFFRKLKMNESEDDDSGFL